MTRLDLTPDLATKAHRIFKKWGWVLPTGADGLTRGELRLLSRKKLIRGTMKKLPSGTFINVWTWEGGKK